MFRRLLAWFRRPPGFVVIEGLDHKDDGTLAIIAKFKAAGYDVIMLGGGSNPRFQVFRY